MNKEDVINGIKERLFNNCELRPSEVLVLKDYINQLETNIDEAIRYINKLVFEDYGVMYDNGTSIMEYEDSCQETLLEILERGKEWK